MIFENIALHVDGKTVKLVIKTGLKQAFYVGSPEQQPRSKHTFLQHLDAS